MKACKASGRHSRVLIGGLLAEERIKLWVEVQLIIDRLDKAVFDFHKAIMLNDEARHSIAIVNRPSAMKSAVLRQMSSLLWLTSLHSVLCGTERDIARELVVNVLLFCDATSTIASLCCSMSFSSIEADLAYLDASDSVDFSQWGAPIQSMAL